MWADTVRGLQVLLPEATCQSEISSALELRASSVQMPPTGLSGKVEVVLLYIGRVMSNR